MERNFFFGDTPCCQNKANPVSHRTPPHGFLPPSQQKSHMLSQYYIWSLCWRFAIEGEGLPYGIIPSWGSSAIGFLPGGRFATWYYSPLGKFCYGISSGGEVCHKVFLQVEGLPYGMVLFPPGEVLPSDFFRGGGGGLPHGITPPPPGKFCYGISSGGRFAIRYSFMGTFAIWYNFRGDNLPWYLFPYQEMCVCGGGGRG